jgi:AcrR family transcriptional regulator
MSTTQRPQRSDAARNRKRLLAAASDVFAEHGLDAGVAEIAERAGVGRGTVFRNFPTKQDLIAAVVVDKMQQAVVDGREQLAGDEGRGTAVFTFLVELVHRQQRERALFEAIADQFLSHPDIRTYHDSLLELINDLLDAGKQAGTVRPEVGAVDVMLLIKGVCSAAAELEGSPELLDRHLALVTAAIAMPGYAVPLAGPTPTVADLTAAHSRSSGA